MAHVLSYGSVLGGARALGRRLPRSDSGWHEIVEAGLPYRAFAALAKTSALGDVELAARIGIPKSTLARRRKSGRFSIDESDRIYRTARIFTLAHTIFADPRRIGAWLREPNDAIGGIEPLALLRTEAGARDVEAMLGRFLFGGYS
ncbi:MAG TPA: antitoxin Xre-like helix-turn-helix domain-containing protein [Candidatus Tyrphobacter sp.]